MMQFITPCLPLSFPTRISTCYQTMMRLANFKIRISMFSFVQCTKTQFTSQNSRQLPHFLNSLSGRGGLCQEIPPPVRWTSRRYASYWNTFLFRNNFTISQILSFQRHLQKTLKKMFAFTQVRLGVLYAGTSRTSLLVTPLSANTRVYLGTAASHKKYGGYNSSVHRHSAHSFSTIFRTVCFNPGEVVDQEVSSFCSKLKC